MSDAFIELFIELGSLTLAVVTHYCLRGSAIPVGGWNVEPTICSRPLERILVENILSVYSIHGGFGMDSGMPNNPNLSIFFGPSIYRIKTCLAYNSFLGGNN